MSELEHEFEIELLVYCDRWEKHGIDASNIKRGVEEFDGAVATAEWYVTHDLPGMDAAIQELGCEATIEWLVAESCFVELFSPQAVESATQKLRSAGC